MICEATACNGRRPATAFVHAEGPAGLYFDKRMCALHAHLWELIAMRPDSTLVLRVYRRLSPCLT